MDTTTLLFLLLGAAAGTGGGFFFAQTKFKKESEDAEAKARQIMSQAEENARKAEARAREADEQKHASLDSARKEADEIRSRSEKLLAEAKAEEKQVREKMEAGEKRIADRENNLDRKLEQIDQKTESLEAKTAEVEKVRGEAEKYREEQKTKLEEVAGLSRDDAKKELINQIEKDSSDELVKKMREAEDKAKDEADKVARNVIAGAIQRYSSEVTTEGTVTLVNLPSDDLKGRIIGREGRNITAFEMATGVDVIVDDTPGAVIISGFDLVRRNVAKIALEKMITDGRIHPAKIESAVKKAREEMDKQMKELGEKAVIEAGVVGLPPNVIQLLGRLNFRTSYGQNNLKHSLEVAHIGGMLAAQIGADEKLAKMACLLHDIGKAVDHEIDGPHAVIGANILKKFNIDERVIHAVEAHHEDIRPETDLDFIVQAADAISATRPGARRESLENYIKRLQELESAATSFDGVSGAFAIQAGREVRVMVNPEKLDDLASMKLAKDIAGKIEKEMSYPGQIKVNVIRETRSEGLAK